MRPIYNWGGRSRSRYINQQSWSAKQITRSEERYRTRQTLVLAIEIGNIWNIIKESHNPSFVFRWLLRWGLKRLEVQIPFRLAINFFVEHYKIRLQVEYTFCSRTILTKPTTNDCLLLFSRSNRLFESIDRKSLYRSTCKGKQKQLNLITLWI